MRPIILHFLQLPDVQIKNLEFIRPLQAVAQRDAPFARSLFHLLFTALYRDLDDKMSPREAEATREDLRTSIQNIQEGSKQYFPTVIACVQEICADLEGFVMNVVVWDIMETSLTHHRGLICTF